MKLVGTKSKLRFRFTKEHSEEVEKGKELLGFQVASLIITGLCFLLWLVVEMFWPDFFNPEKYWCITEDVFVSVFKFYPLFIYCGILSLVTCIWIKSSFDAEHILLTNIATSILAGVWEELGFRCIYIMTAMIGIVFFNWCWEVLMIFVTLFGIFSFLAGIGKQNPQFLITGFIVTVICGGMLYFVYANGIEGPVYWFYEKIIFPVLSFISFGKLDPILFNQSFGFLFIAGAVSANAKFRDGHKYQGPIGFLNAWAVGFVLLYAMLYHGLIVAILIHALYDIEVGLIRYGYRKVISFNGQ